MKDASDGRAEDIQAASNASGAAPDIGFPRGLWYVAMAGRRLAPGRMEGLTLFGELILVGRRKDGSVFAFRGICPHRGMPLHHGAFDGETVRCPYHGWGFDGEGRCVDIPSLTADRAITLERIRCRSYPCAEKQGLIWIYADEPGQPMDADPGAPPTLGAFADDAVPNADVRLVYEWSFDNAAYGLIDPSHVAYVHGKWWLGNDTKRLADKEKHFEPCERGWRMVTHEAPKRSLAHRLLGANVKTDIETWLPGLRLERIAGERHHVLNLLAITPIDAERTQMIQCLWWSMKGLGFLRPAIERIAHRFLSQDGDVAIKHREGLAYGEPQMLIRDADTQMRWWLRLNQEWRAHRRDGRPFENPVEPATLRYRS